MPLLQPGTYASKLLEWHRVSISKNGDCSQTDNITKRVDAAKRPPPVFMDDSRRKKRRFVPIPKLASGETGEPTYVLGGKSGEFSHCVLG
jgi:hypothetical protein